YIELHEILRSDTNLRELSREIYGPLDDHLKADDKSIAELHVVSRMLQVMEDVWVGLQLDDYADYPLYAGWLEVFRRWTGSRIFRRHWQTLKAEYSEGFVRFCNRLLEDKTVVHNAD